MSTATVEQEETKQETEDTSAPQAANQNPEETEDCNKEPQIPHEKEKEEEEQEQEKDGKKQEHKEEHEEASNMEVVWHVVEGELQNWSSDEQGNRDEGKCVEVQGKADSYVESFATNTFSRLDRNFGLTEEVGNEGDEANKKGNEDSCLDSCGYLYGR